MDKPRAVIFNNDGCDSYVYPKSRLPFTIEKFLKLRTSPLVSTDITTISYCTLSSSFGQFTHNTKVGEFLLNTHKRKGRVNVTPAFAKLKTDPLREVIKYAHANKMEVFWSNRVNDTHDSGHRPSKPYERWSKLKQAHPEYLMGKCGERFPNGRWSAVDFTHQEIRELAVKYVTEVCKNYDVDGIELDFFRHLYLFKSVVKGGKASPEELKMLTDTLREIRTMTERVGMRRGRPILVAIRIPDSVEYCRELGIDLQKWLKEGLIDIIIGSGYFRLNDWEYFVKLGHKYNVKVYAGLSEPRVRNQHPLLQRHNKLTYRARAAEALQAGVDGIYLFNQFSVSSPKMGYIREIGNIKKLSKTNKLHFITYRNGSPSRDLKNGIQHQNMKILAPGKAVCLSSTPSRYLIYTGDESAAKSAKLILYGRSLSPGTLSVDLNGSRLKFIRIRKGLLYYELPVKVLKAGKNVFSISSSTGIGTSVSNTILKGDKRLVWRTQGLWRRLFSGTPRVDKIVDKAYLLGDLGSGNNIYNFIYPWNASPNGKISISFNAKLKSTTSPDAVCVRVSNGKYAEYLRLEVNKISLKYARKSFKLNTKSKFHKYKIVLNKSTIKPLAKPTSANNTVVGVLGTDYIFQEIDFPYTDNGGGGLTFVEVTGLTNPVIGTLYLSGVAVVSNQSISVADINSNKFTYISVAGGTDDFAFKVTDIDGTSNPAKTITININTPPTSANNTVITVEDVQYVFVIGDFPFNDVDGDALSKIMITGIESVGTLYLDANSNSINDAEDIVANQEILVADITKLKFIPNLDESGASYDSFSFKVNDGNHYSNLSYVMTIDVTIDNDAPTSLNNTVSTDENTNFVFATADFAFADVDNVPPLTEIEITTIPGNGTLWVDTDLDGTANEGALINLSTVPEADILKLTFKPVDYEFGSPYTTFTFKVSDGALFSVAPYTMTINVNFVNQEPTLTLGANISIPEDSPAQTDLAYASSDPREVGQIVSYSVSNDDNSLFSVQPIINSSGDLTYTPAANANGMATVTVTAVDNGGGNDTSVPKTFTITLTPLDDDPTISNQTKNVDENSINGTVVGTVAANDVDGDALTFLITAGNTNTAFAIASPSGQITVNNSAELDYEVTTNYPLTVQVSDGAGPVASATVTIDINNVNDVAPTISNVALPNIDENSPNGTIVGTPTFTETEGDAITFTITAGNTNNAFAINSPSGQVVVANSSALDFETTPNFILTVQIDDGVFTDIANNITVALNNAQDPPRFTSSPGLLAVVGNIYTYNVTIVDDEGDAITIDYFTRPTWLTTFTDNGNGTGTLSGTPTITDAGANPVLIKATDDGVPNETKEQSFTINVASSVINVPVDYATIQLAIDNAGAGDIITVDDGTYNENIDFGGTNVVIMGNTGDPSQVIINGTGGSVVTFNSGESSSAKLNGFTIVSGTGTNVDLAGSYNPSSLNGGGIYCVGASPTLENLVITGCTTT
ncbi:MAG: cadherin domain-containing protein, partial [Flavobacteriaceae bacterium]